MKYDESDNVVIRATRVVTDKLSDVFSKSYLYGANVNILMTNLILMLS